MDEMIRYIFGSLRNSDSALRVISKTLKKQNSFNRNITFLSILTVLHVVMHEMEIRNMQRELVALQKEIKELKNTEGD
jgi:hypothetical protein